VSHESNLIKLRKRKLGKDIWKTKNDAKYMLKQRTEKQT